MFIIFVQFPPRIFVILSTPSAQVQKFSYLIDEFCFEHHVDTPPMRPYWGYVHPQHCGRILSYRPSIFPSKITHLCCSFEGITVNLHLSDVCIVLICERGGLGGSMADTYRNDLLLRSLGVRSHSWP